MFRQGMFDELYRKNTGLIHHICKRYTNLNADYEDIEACGDIAFAKCMKDFDPDKSKFATYFSRVLINEILMLHRKIKKHNCVISLQSKIGEDKDGNSITVEDKIVGDDSLEQDVETKAILSQAMSAIEYLDDTPKSVMKMFLGNKNQAEIADELGISQSYVSRILRKTQKQVRDMCGNKHSMSKAIAKAQKSNIYKGDGDMRNTKKKDLVFECFEKGMFDLDEIVRITGTTISSAKSYRALWRRQANAEQPNQEPIKQEPIKQEPIKREPIKRESVKQEPVKQTPAIESGLRVSRLTGALGEYDILNGKVSLLGEQCYFDLEFDQIDTLIKELNDIKKFI